jgi:hypothetical protein
MRSMDHASSNCLLLLVKGLLLWALRNFDHLLEVEEAAEGVSMSLSLHHGQRLLVGRSLPMDRALLNMHLLVFAVFHVVLVLHVLEVLELVVLSLQVEHGRVLLALGHGRLGVACPVNVVRLDLEVLLLVLPRLLGLPRGGALAEDAVLPRRRRLVRPHVVGRERVHSPCVILKSMLVVLVLFRLLKLTLRWARRFLGHAALDHVVVVAASLRQGAAAKPRGHAGVARKVEQLLAEGGDLGSSVVESSSFTFLNALIENAVDVLTPFARLCATLPLLPWRLYVRAQFGLVGTHASCHLQFRLGCLGLDAISIFLLGAPTFLNFVFLIIWVTTTKIFWIYVFLAIYLLLWDCRVCYDLGRLLCRSHSFTAEFKIDFIRYFLNL